MQKIRDILQLRDKKLDSIKVTPIVTFFEGTPNHPLKHIATTKGHLVNNGLIGLINQMSISTWLQYGAWMNNVQVGSSGVPTFPSIRIGTGNAATTASTTALASIINTPPNAITGLNANPSTGTYTSTITATWNAGTLSAYSINEAAVYAYVYNALCSFGQVNPNNSTTYLVDRVSTGNSDFNAFTVNTTKPLSVQYQFQVAFA